MPEANLSTPLGHVLAIDAVEQFSTRINSLSKLMTNFNLIAKPEGVVVKTYKSTVTLADGNVAPGEVIPLSKVVMEPAENHELAFTKIRKAVTIEDQKRYGDAAFAKSDEKLLNAIQKNVRNGMIESLAAGTGARSGANFQKTLAKNTAAVRIAFDEDDPSVVSFVNTEDVYDYLGEAQVTVQTAFGMDYLENFLGNAVVFMSGDIPRGKIYSTAVGNLNFYYSDFSAGIVGDGFEFVTNEDGFIGVTHFANKTRAQYETLVMYAILWLPERLDGVVVGTIDAPEEAGAVG